MGKSFKLKIITLGDQYSGKTSILNRYKTNTFLTYSTSTIGVDFFTSNINKNDTNYTLNIWDTSGQEKFNSIITSYYRNIVVAILVFDVSNIKSFNNLKKWLNNIDCYCNDDVIIKLVGNKCDKKIEVDERDINLLCRDYNIDYLEVSAKDNINIELLFNNIIDDVDNKLINCVLVPNNNNGISIIDKFKIEDIKKIKKVKEPKCCIIL